MVVNRTRLEPDVRKGQILAAARQVFTETGFSEASMEEVAKEAGVVRGLVNHYFGTKRELYLAVVAEVASELPQMVRTDLGALPVEEIVELNMKGFLDTVESRFELWAILLGAEAAGRDDEVAAIVGAARDEVVERMARNHAGENPSAELLLALRVFQGAAETAAGEWLARGRASREQVHGLLTRTLLALVSR